MKRLFGAGRRAELPPFFGHLAKTYRPQFNEEFQQPAPEQDSAFVACQDLTVLDEILCEHFSRVVGKDNCVRFEGLVLQIPADRHRCHYVKTKVKVLRHLDGTLTIKHGHRELARYDVQGKVLDHELPAAACSTLRKPRRAMPCKNLWAIKQKRTNLFVANSARQERLYNPRLSSGRL